MSILDDVLIRALLRSALPAIVDHRYMVEAGALVSFAPDLTQMDGRRAAIIDKVLRGAMPADVPIEQPTRFELVINLRTAEALGLTVPRSLLLRADALIR